MKVGQRNAESRRRRLARYTVRYFQRALDRAGTDPIRREVAITRYQKACALLVAHKLLSGAGDVARSAERAALIPSPSQAQCITPTP